MHEKIFSITLSAFNSFRLEFVHCKKWLFHVQSFHPIFQLCSQLTLKIIFLIRVSHLGFFPQVQMLKFTTKKKKERKKWEEKNLMDLTTWTLSLYSFRLDNILHCRCHIMWFRIRTALILSYILFWTNSYSCARSWSECFMWLKTEEQSSNEQRKTLHFWNQVLIIQYSFVNNNCLLPYDITL